MHQLKYVMGEGKRKPGFIPEHGGYRKLMTYQRAEIIYDATVRFTGLYFDRYDRTAGQMVQAARSGKPVPDRMSLEP